MQGIFLNKIRQWVVKFETIFISVFVFRKNFLKYWVEVEMTIIVLTECFICCFI